MLRKEKEVQKIAGKNRTKIRLFYAGLFCQYLQRKLLHFFLSLLPRLLSKVSVFICQVKVTAKWSFLFFLSGNTGPKRNDWRIFKRKALLSR